MSTDRIEKTVLLPAPRERVWRAVGLAENFGSWFGAAFILLLPGQIHALIAWAAKLVGADIGIETLSHLPYAVYGGMIILFLLLEPMGLGKLYGNVRNYLMVWPFGYVRK